MNTLVLLPVLLLAQYGQPLPEPPAAEPHGIRFGVTKLDTGVRLHYAEQGDSTGTPVILLHGYSDSWFSWSDVLPLLPSSYRVFALDLRGHGMSDKPATGYGMDDLASDVIAFMEQKQLAGVTLVGHSTGGYVAQQVALAASQRLARLVLVATTTTPNAILGMRDFDAVVNGLADPVPTEFIREFQMSTIHRPLAPEFVERVISESGRLPAHVWRGVMAGMLAMQPLRGLEGSAVPTMVLWGERDTLMPRTEQDALVRMFPTVVFKVYRDTGHALHWERPAEFTRDLVGFMTS
jgi:pimeloyl-ACP methyl ester carboxylesterase